MDTKLKINPVDLQDREGFLAYLQAQAREGWEAARIWPTATVFRRTETPSRGYTMGFDPDGRWPDSSAEGHPRIPGLENTGIGIYPADRPAEPDPSWGETFLDARGEVPSFSTLGIGRRLAHGIPVLLLLLLLFRDTDFGRWLFQDLSSMVIQGPIIPILLTLSLLSIVIDLLEWWASRRHAIGLGEARAWKRVYRPDDALSRFIPLKNALSFLQAPLAVVEVVLLLPSI